MQVITVSTRHAEKLKEFQAGGKPAVLVRDLGTGTPILVAHGADKDGEPIPGHIAMPGTDGNVYGYPAEQILSHAADQVKLSQADREAMRWLGCWCGLSPVGWDETMKAPISFMVHKAYGQEDLDEWRVSIMTWELMGD